MILVRYPKVIENQPINEVWDERLASLSSNFAHFGRRAWPTHDPGDERR